MSNFKELVRLGKDAVVRQTTNGKSVTGFSAAFDSGWGDSKTTIWLDCNAWGDRYEKVSPYLLKGSQIVVAGNIGTREYEGKTYITLDVQDIKLCGKPAEAQSDDPARRPAPRQSAPAQNEAQRPANFDDFDDSITPF